jgi:uncharacterized protein (TIGR03086 family)
MTTDDSDPTAIADRYRRLAGDFARLLDRVADDGWTAPTPCSDWSVAELVDHVISTQGMFRGFVGRANPELPEDRRRAWAEASGLVQADLDDPERAAQTFQGHFGEQTFAAAVDRFLNTDLVIHGWDLARATGQDDRIDPSDVRRVAEVATGFGEAMRGPGAFGPEIEPAADADEQERLLAFLGRSTR